MPNSSIAKKDYNIYWYTFLRLIKFCTKCSAHAFHAIIVSAFRQAGPCFVGDGKKNEVQFLVERSWNLKAAPDLLLLHKPK